MSLCHKISHIVINIKKHFIIFIKRYAKLDEIPLKNSNSSLMNEYEVISQLQRKKTFPRGLEGRMSWRENVSGRPATKKSGQ